MFPVLLAAMLASQSGADSPGRGISEALARDRAASIRGLRYELSFTVPDDVAAPVQGRAVLRFTLRRPQAVVIDFAPPRDQVRAVQAGGAAVSFTASDGHLTIPADAT